MNTFILYEYLKDVSGIMELNEEQYIEKDLRLTSKEIVDLAIFINREFNVRIEFYKDIKLKDLINKIEI